MKKIIFANLFGLISLYSCSDKKEASVTPDQQVVNAKPEDTQDKAITNIPVEISEGEALVGRADCASCHAADAKLVGPSYVDIAKKYSDKDVESLARKIIAGGQGSWGAIPMTPHSTLGEEDAKKMVKYLLSLRK